MNTRKILLGLLMTLFLSTLLFAGSALATPVPTEVKFTFQYQKSHTIHPGKAWIDETGLHIRDQVDYGFIWGDINGTAVVIYNADFVIFSLAKGFVPEEQRPAPNSGGAYGSVTLFDSKLDIIPEVLEGNWTYSVLNGTVVGGELTAWNAGLQQIMRIDRVSEGPDDTITYQGTLQHLPCSGLKCSVAQ